MFALFAAFHLRRIIDGGPFHLHFVCCFVFGTYAFPQAAAELTNHSPLYLEEIEGTFFRSNVVAFCCVFFSIAALHSWHICPFPHRNWMQNSHYLLGMEVFPVEYEHVLYFLSFLLLLWVSIIVLHF